MTASLLALWREPAFSKPFCIGLIALLLQPHIVSNAAEYSFSNPDPIQFQDFSPASPYPSVISVNNVTGVVAKVTVTLVGLTHSRPSDVDILLVAPGGESALLLSDAGGSSLAPNLTIVFDDAALTTEREFDPLVAGTFRPTNYDSNDNFPAPAPAAVGGNSLGVFKGTNPNGDWRLFVVDDEIGEIGQIAEGWRLNITAHSRVFTNPTPLGVPDVGIATLYPSAILVAGVAEPITKLTVTLRGLSHTFPSDLDVLLVGPNGQNVVLMSDAGGATDANDITLTFDDSVPDPLPPSGPLVSGVFRPTNIDDSDVFNLPAPGGPYGTTLAQFNQTMANGEWHLFVLDDSGSDSGAIATGWSLAITTEHLVITTQPLEQTASLGGMAQLCASAGGDRSSPLSVAFERSGPRRRHQLLPNPL